MEKKGGSKAWERQQDGLIWQEITDVHRKVNNGDKMEVKRCRGGTKTSTQWRTNSNTVEDSNNTTKRAQQSKQHKFTWPTKDSNQPGDQLQWMQQAEARKEQRLLCKDSYLLEETWQVFDTLNCEHYKLITFTKLMLMWRCHITPIDDVAMKEKHSSMMWSLPHTTILPHHSVLFN